MAGFIELIAKIKPKNNGTYPLVDDVDVEMEDGSRLSEAIKKPRIPDGGTKGQILAKKSNTNGDAEWVEPLKTEDIDKKLENKLDKNLGAENSDKILITDAKGNIITQNKEDFEGSGGTTNYNSLTNKPSINGVELIGNKISSDLKMYTKEEVNDLLYDKMDKPYAPITISDDTTIEDCLDGYFKIDKIRGNTYQAEETDIVPTPQRPIPINSRITTITKINPNIFDLEKESDISNIPDTGTYRSIGQYQLKANTKYIFGWSEANVPGKGTLSFQIQDDKGTVLVSPFTYFNLETTEKKEAGKKVEFTTNSSGIVKFAYNCTVATSSTTETYQQYWYTKILKDITLKEDVEYESEHVELRSLKETINKFDLGLLSQVNLIPDNKELYRKINIPITLKPNTRYKIYYEKSMLPALTWMVLNIVDNTERVIVEILNVENTENNEVEKQAINLAFTSPVDGEIYFSYYIQSYNAEGDLIPQSTELFKEKWFTKILKNIMITEDSLNQTTYIPPTVRDYKIIDHTNKTAKIIRNVGLYVDDKTGNGWNVYDNEKFQNSYLKIINDMKISNRILSYSNSFEVINKNTSFDKVNSMWIGVNNPTVFVIKTDFTSLDEWKVWLASNDLEFLYPLETPTEEEIAYSADDVSEVGYSWQDTTSPSPTIKSEVKGVEEIDITVTGKNLFDLEKAKNKENWIESTVQPVYIDFMIRVKKGVKYLFSHDNKLSTGVNFYAGIVNAEDITNASITDWIYHSDMANLIKDRVIFTTKGEYISLRVSIYGFDNMLENLKNIQLEVGDIRTEYEPYTAQTISCKITTPLRGIGDVTDTIDIENGVIQRNIGIVEFDGSSDEDWRHDGLNLNMSTRFYGLLGTEVDSNHNINYDYKTMCNKLVIKSGDIADEEYFRLSCGVENKQYYFVYLKKSRLDELSNTAFRSWLASNPITIWYELIEPTTEALPEEDLAKLKSLKTEQGVTNIFVGGEVKPTIEARYVLDIASIVSKLQTKLLTIQEEVVKNV